MFEGARCDFVGKCSPVHFFWGGFDLAVTRFSGRPAPPREGPAFMREAYSHEVISHGFWFGGGPVLEPAFYAYAVPEPPGLKAARVQPRGAFYHGELGEFILPYETVRKSDSPEDAIVAFVDSTYEQAATLGALEPHAALERAPAPHDVRRRSPSRSAGAARAVRGRRTARLTMIMAHGRGASAEDVLSLAGEFQTKVNVAFLAPQAAGRTWYPLSVSLSDRRQ